MRACSIVGPHPVQIERGPSWNRRSAQVLAYPSAVALAARRLEIAYAIASAERDHFDMIFSRAAACHFSVWSIANNAATEYAGKHAPFTPIMGALGLGYLHAFMAP
jgi:hypothetical protein